MFFPKTIFGGYSFPKNVIFGDSLFPKTQFWGYSFPKNDFWGIQPIPKIAFWGVDSQKSSSPKYSFGEMSYTSCWKISPSQKHSFGKILPSQKRIFGNRNLLFLCIINKMEGDFIAILLSNHQYHS